MVMATVCSVRRKRANRRSGPSSRQSTARCGGTMLNMARCQGQPVEPSSVPRTPMLGTWGSSCIWRPMPLAVLLDRTVARPPRDKRHRCHRALWRLRSATSPPPVASISRWTSGAPRRWRINGVAMEALVDARRRPEDVAFLQLVVSGDAMHDPSWAASCVADSPVVAEERRLAARSARIWRCPPARGTPGWAASLTAVDGGHRAGGHLLELAASLIVIMGRESHCKGRSPFRFVGRNRLPRRSGPQNGQEN